MIEAVALLPALFLRSGLKRRAAKTTASSPSAERILGSRWTEPHRKTRIRPIKTSLSRGQVRSQHSLSHLNNRRVLEGFLEGFLLSNNRTRPKLISLNLNLSVSEW